MSFTRINPSGWGFGDKLTSAQQNSLDIDHANAVDKTSAGDTISGTLTLGTGGKIQSGGSGVIVDAKNSGAIVQASASGAIIQATGSGALIQATGSGALIKTVSGGRIQLGDSDYPTFSAARSYVIASSYDFVQTISGSWNYTSSIGYPALVSGATGARARTVIKNLHNGGTLSNVTFYWIIAPSRPNSTAAVLPPAIIVSRLNVTTGVVDSLGSGGPSSSTDVANDLHSWGVTISSNNVIDTTTYVYYLDVIEESSTNSQPGNIFTGFTCTFSSVTDMRY